MKRYFLSLLYNAATVSLRADMVSKEHVRQALKVNHECIDLPSGLRDCGFVFPEKQGAVRQILVAKKSPSSLGDMGGTSTRTWIILRVKLVVAKCSEILEAGAR